MPYYKSKNILFIHIPKTGGRVIENEIKKKSRQTLYCAVKQNPLLPEPFNKCSLQHQFYTTLYKFRNKLNINFNNIKVFSVVRNPYDRVISDLFWFKLIKKNYDSTKVYNVIKNKYLNRNDLDNHNKPQYKFVTDEMGVLIPNIKIFKTEQLNQSNDKLSNFLGLKINVKNKGRVVNKDYSKYINQDSISLINDVYKKDFELFGYEMK
jgi:hypothetical protein